MSLLTIDAFFDLASYAHEDLFCECSYPWDALKRLSSYIEMNLQPGILEKHHLGIPLPEALMIWKNRVWSKGFECLGGDVTKGKHRVRIGDEETCDAVVLHAGAVIWDDRVTFGPGTVVEPGALIKGPTIVGGHTEIRQGAYIRGKCLIGSRCVVGHTTEMKSSIMLDGAKAGHFAYIGDSILGADSNLGAGTKLANLKVRGSVVKVRVGTETIDTGLRKLGAIIGDGVEVGCNSVTNPGVLLGRGCLVLPLSSVAQGYHEPRSIIRR